MKPKSPKKSKVCERTFFVLAVAVGVLGAACEGEGEPGAVREGGTADASNGADGDSVVFFEKAIAAEDEVFSSAELMPYFESLPPVGIESMIGTWRGGKFDGGQPDPINWWGKQVLSADEALGFLCERDDGTIYSWELLGLASMDELDFHGVRSAALVYDNGFMTDYFRRVSDDVVVGYSPIGYGEYEDLFFHLTRVEDFDVE